MGSLREHQINDFVYANRILLIPFSSLPLVYYNHGEDTGKVGSICKEGCGYNF